MTASWIRGAEAPSIPLHPAAGNERHPAGSNGDTTQPAWALWPAVRMRYLARGCSISGYRGRSTISSEEARMSRWPCVTGALSVGIFVFTGSGQGYNGGPLRNVTYLTPQCASCHSSMTREDLRVEPEA